MKVSNCCRVYGDYRIPYGDTYETAEICHYCGEHCEYIEETDLVFGCEAGDHDLVPVLGFENEITGEVCRQCGKKF